MGKIVTLQDNGWYQYELPEPPRDEREVLFYDLPKKEQYWRIPPRLNFKNCTQTQKVEFINQERERWLNGCWFFNNGEPTYITGMHYDHLVNQTFEFGKAMYFDQQRLDFYMRDYTRNDNNCYGTVWFKPRRYGMTAEELTNAIYAGMEDFKRFIGLVSNEGTKCITTLMRPIIDCIIARPKYMRPNFYRPSGKKPRKAMEFHDGQIEFDEDGAMEEFSSLAGHIFPYNTTAAAMDGTKKHYIIMDEVWKWIIASVMETLGVVKKCVENFGIAGKLSLLSTMGDSDDYHEAVKEGIKIGDDSNPDVRDLNGRTTSGLYRYFVSAIHSKVLPIEFTDKYGFVNKDRATTFIMNDRAKLDPNSKEYLFEVRRMPLSYEEAVLATTNLSTFDNVRLSKRKTYLAGLPVNKKPYVVGFLDEIPGSDDIDFRPDPNGIWKIGVFPYKNAEQGIDTTNNFRKSGGKISPPRRQEFCFGYDPVRYADLTADKKSVSRMSILIRKVFDYYGGGKINKYAALCYIRPLSGHDGHKEAMKAAKFFGMSGMHERQVETVEEDFEEAGMSDMLMNNEKDGKKGIWTDNNRKTVKNGVDMITADMKVRADGSDPVDDMIFEEHIIDRMSFNPLKTTPNDITMSDIMLHHGMKQMKFTNQTESNKDNKAIRTVLFRV